MSSFTPDNSHTRRARTHSAGGDDDRARPPDGPPARRTADFLSGANSDLDLFGEAAGDDPGPDAPGGWASRPRPSPWGEGSSASDMSKTPRTTASFIPGYDWNRKGGFFDEAANDMQRDSGFDFEKSYEDDWMPKID